ncbi:MAG: hypothetical protein H7210_12580 [Pyrinomonadaceae bacterium]|nr:hypothetical protein [Phycisphaerales bacterium]
MPKLTPARLDGFYGMLRLTLQELHELADEYQRQVTSPHNTDDPKWLRRLASRIRKLAEGKEAAEEHKRNQGKSRLRQASVDQTPRYMLECRADLK